MSYTRETLDIKRCPWVYNCKLYSNLLGLEMDMDMRMDNRRRNGPMTGATGVVSSKVSEYGLVGLVMGAWGIFFF